MMAVLAPIELRVLENRRLTGAAGAWNTGLAWLLAGCFSGYVAMLDDDDSWDDDHGEVNLRCAQSIGATVVVSGLRHFLDMVEKPRPLPTSLTDRMFLTGNPGLQGSNTFVAIESLAQVGGFRDGLASCNDRDLAIRLLRLPGVRLAYTGKWTSTWHQSSARTTLSSVGSPAKLRGLRWFWQLYGAEMSAAESTDFFARAARLFKLEPADILAAPLDRPPHTRPLGDL